MYEQERKKEARAVPPSEERMTREEMMPGTVTPMTTTTTMPMVGAAPSPWYSRISWGSILAGVLVAIASQLLLSALGVFIGYGTVAVTSISDLQDVSAAVGIWTAISALISSFIGGFVASRLASVRYSSDGLWHGLSVWAFALVAGILLSAVGIYGLLGFAGNAAAALRGFISTGVQLTPNDLNAAADVASTTAGYFLLGAGLSLAAALLGGWLGSRRISRAEEMGMETTTRERMAA